MTHSQKVHFLIQHINMLTDGEVVYTNGQEMTAEDVVSQLADLSAFGEHINRFAADVSISNALVTINSDWLTPKRSVPSYGRKVLQRISKTLAMLIPEKCLQFDANSEQNLQAYKLAKALLLVRSFGRITLSNEIEE